MAITQRRLTLEEFLKLPERKPALEYMHGKATQKVSPKAKHGSLQFALTEIVNRFARPRRLAWALPETRATFAGFSPVPDVVVYRWERIPRDEAGEVADDIFEPPDIAVEIASPRQRRQLLVERCRWYVANGVPLALLVDPRTRWVWRFGADGSEQALWDDDRIDLSSVLPGFELAVRELFDTLRVG